MNLQNMTFKYKLVEMEEEGEYHENIVTIHEATDPAMVKVNL